MKYQLRNVTSVFAAIGVLAPFALAMPNGQYNPNLEVQADYNLDAMLEGTALEGETFQKWLQNKKDYAPVGLYKTPEGDMVVHKDGTNVDYARRNQLEYKNYNLFYKMNVFPRVGGLVEFYDLSPNTKSLRPGEMFPEEAAANVLKMPYYAGGSIADVPRETFSKYFNGQISQLCDAILVFMHRVADLHEKGAALNGIKPGNIPFIESIGEFGIFDLENFASHYEEYPRGGSKFRSPQADLYAMDENAPKVDCRREDVYGMATTIGWMLTGEHFKEKKGEETAREFVTDEAYDILQRMMAEDPEDRPTMRQATNMLRELRAKGAFSRI